VPARFFYNYEIKIDRWNLLQLLARPVIVGTNQMLERGKGVHELLEVHTWEVALGSLGRRELVHLHVTESFAAMVVRAQGHQLRHVSFRLSAHQRLQDIEDGYWLLIAQLNLLVEDPTNSNDPLCFIKWVARACRHFSGQTDRGKN
jgi:hypothetical protein